jgi:nitroimidazol reductase NimA-like FMN-containing flavoprotein (pyridoxamine 5'-phosphate oxidase superfamily)
MTSPVPSRALLELEEREALALASTAPVGRLCFVRDERLFVSPVNFLLEARDVLLRTAEDTDVLDAARHRCTAALEVDDLVEWSRSGWSVLVRGRLEEVTDQQTVERVLAAPLRPWAGGRRDRVVRLAGVEVTGKRIEPGPGGTTVVAW